MPSSTLTTRMSPDPSGTSEPLDQAAHLSITDFLTDGSLAAFCAEMSRLTGVRVELRDPLGHAIVKNADANATKAWSVSVTAAQPTRTMIPLLLGGVSIGAIAVEDGAPTLGTDARQRLENALQLLARTSGDLCQHELELRHRIKEVAALARMSSMLVRAASTQQVLDMALESALDVLGLDAGSVMLLKDRIDGPLPTAMDEHEEDLTVRASRNLSKDWLDYPYPLSKDRVFDTLALSGNIVVSEDLSQDPRVALVKEAAEEGLAACIHAGLVFKNRPLGIIRLYSRLPRSFDDADKRLLASIAGQAAVAIEQSRLMKFEQEEQRVQRQLQLAADVQRRMLPKGVPSIKSLDVAARYIPSFELGGDFYDFMDLNGHFGFAVGDVVGKGIAAALLMSSVRASLRAHAQQVYDLDEIVSRVNQALCRDTRDNEFSSLWYGVIDPQRLRLTYCSAGHEPPMVIRVPKHRPPTAADMDELSVGGMVVGIDPSQRYQRAVFDLAPNDMLVAYTDGVVDATNFNGERFGKKRLREAVLRALQEKPESSATELVERILWESRQFTGLAPRPDDKTLVVLRVLER